MSHNSKEIKLEICQFIQKNLAAMGFTRNQQKSNNGQWSFGQIVGIVKYSIDIISLGAYVLFEADSIDEYILSIFVLILTIMITITFVSIIYKNDKLFEIIEQCANVLTISKSFVFGFFIIFHLIQEVNHFV